MKPIPELVKTPTDLLVYLGNIIEELQAENEAVKESNKNLMELVTMLREEVNKLREV